ncbi:DMT family transporter [Sphingobium sp.]|uniref:DMT family transporter n=1 Tax=Sphingobium sp. TaxID=1912891 RepID=UPI0028BF4C98|nr:DMT family transporter [Sphingobium sp.]
MRTDERGAMLVAATGFALLSVSDAVVKCIIGLWPPVAIAALRFAIGAGLLATLVALREGRAGFAVPAPRIQLLRGVGMAVASACFFASVKLLPLATTTAIFFTSPMITAILSSLILKEKAERRTWFSIAVAFTGVLVVLRPNILLLGWPAMLPLVGAFGMSLMVIGNRVVAGRSSALGAQVVMAGIAAVCLAPFALVVQSTGFGPAIPGPPEARVIIGVVLVASLASLAHGLVYLGTTRAIASQIAPMTYIQIVGAVSFGWLLFDEHPDFWTLIGITVIVGAGLFLWQSERQTLIEPAPWSASALMVRVQRRKCANSLCDVDSEDGPAKIIWGSHDKIS